MACFDLQEQPQSGSAVLKPSTSTASTNSAPDLPVTEGGYTQKPLAGKLANLGADSKCFPNYGDQWVPYNRPKRSSKKRNVVTSTQSALKKAARKTTRNARKVNKSNLHPYLSHGQQTHPDAFEIIDCGDDDSDDLELLLQTLPVMRLEGQASGSTLPPFERSLSRISWVTTDDCEPPLQSSSRVSMDYWLSRDLEAYLPPRPLRTYSTSGQFSCPNGWDVYSGVLATDARYHGGDAQFQPGAGITPSQNPTYTFGGLGQGIPPSSSSAPPLPVETPVPGVVGAGIASTSMTVYNQPSFELEFPAGPPVYSAQLQPYCFQYTQPFAINERIQQAHIEDMNDVEEPGNPR
ncbi:hypothetical protein CVT24_005497 [Panaeolus cyanescens]|uniref:Uncharacterized protein n=1 Tax=Panaeolus cyanescens TaxID=181874 RepID=A0A409WVX7_9AGAR|nr:hypothetical protein CVT24_005497 [Panaeolus cyanescens]